MTRREEALWLIGFVVTVLAVAGALLVAFAAVGRWEAARFGAASGGRAASLVFTGWGGIEEREVFTRLLISPGLFGGAYGIFLLRQFFLTLPADLEDAARMDGCNPLQSFLFVALPLCKPALATLLIFGFVGGWNDFMAPLTYLNSAEKFPLQLVLSEFRSLYYTDWTLIMAGSLLASLPLILLYLLCQRAFIQGIALTGIKS